MAVVHPKKDFWIMVPGGGCSPVRTDGVKREIIVGKSVTVSKLPIVRWWSLTLWYPVISHNDLWSLHLRTPTVRQGLMLSQAKWGFDEVAVTPTPTCVCEYMAKRTLVRNPEHKLNPIIIVTQALDVLSCPKMLLNRHVFNRKMKTEIFY